VTTLAARDDLRAELEAVRRQALARVTEMDLLVAALRDHIRDLQAERDALRAELARLRRERLLERATWLARGLRPQR
jgi:cell division protein FtsB